MVMLKITDLCCGIGGFPRAFNGIGESIFASDLDKYARITYDLNFKGHQFVDDIYKIDIPTMPTCDILCAGFPCQPFSLAGNQEGFKHEAQGNIFFRLAEIIEATRPPAIFLENVKNLQSHDNGKTFRTIKMTLEKIGYHVKHTLLNATEYGNLPQNRERVYIVGFLDDRHYAKFQFPNKIPLTAKLFGDIIDISKKQDAWLYQTNIHSPSVKKMILGITEKYAIYQYRRYTVRKNMRGVCPTLTANMGSGGHNVPLLLDDFGIRKLSVEECFLLQGFPVPDIYRLPPLAVGHLYHQIGNSVPVPVVKRIAERIGEVL
jgi:DNA (cytosine-5)-methyltransferase 1